MYKKGDKFKIVKGMDNSEWGRKGDIIILTEDTFEDEAHAYFLYPSGETWTYHFSDLKPIPTETEAEKRGAKFGTTGVVKATGSKWVFGKEINGAWWGMNEEGLLTSGASHTFRLDHEPEYKEIPFREATDEQRLNVDNLVHVHEETVTQIVKFDNGAFVYTLKGYDWARTNTERLKVRVPA